MKISEKKGIGSFFLQQKINILLFAFIFSIGFTDLLTLPFIGKKIQISEFIFIIIFFVLFFQLAKQKRLRYWKSLRFDLLDYGVLSYLLFILLSCFHSFCNSCWLETLGTFYLIGIYFIIKYLFQFESSTVQQMPTKTNRNSSLFYSPQLQANQSGNKLVRFLSLEEVFYFFRFSFIYLGLAVAIFGIVGWILANIGISTTLAWSNNEYYPYLGYIGRASGFTATPGMLVSILIVCSIWFLAEKDTLKDFSLKDYLIIGVYSLAILFSFSKSILLFFTIILLWFLKKNIFNFFLVKKGIYGLILSLIFVFNIGTHFLIVDATEPKAKDSFFHGRFASKEVIAKIGDKWNVHTTPYFELKKVAFFSGIEFFPFGVGAGCFQEFLNPSIQSDSKEYPSEFWAYEPHSTIFGSFGELGFLGFSGFLFICICIYKELISLQRKNGESPIVFALQICFFYFLLESISTDLMNFRFFWVMIAILGAVNRN